MSENLNPKTAESLSGDKSSEKKITVAEKWQGAVNEDSGFVAIPMTLLRLQTKLKLTATDMVVLTNLLAHWWDPKRAVFPRSTMIAQRMGVTKRTVQRSTQKMIVAGLIDRTFLENGRRAFQFDALAARLARDLPLTQMIRGREVLDQ